MGEIYSTLLKNAIIPVSDKVMGTSIASSYRQITKMSGFTKDEVIQWQNMRLNALIEHAYNHTDYYRRLFSDSGLLPKDINSKEDLSKIPVLTKEEIRKNFSRLIPDNINSILYKNSATGGSTGDPLKYYLDYRSWSMISANNIFNWEKTGYNYGDKYIALGSTSLFLNKKQSPAHRIYYRLKSKIGLSGINMSDEICKKYISLIRQRKIRFIYGYASSIYLLAKYALKERENLDIKVCFSTSEILTDRYRETILKAFKCKILDCYGANDGGIAAFAHHENFYEVGYNCMVRIDNPDDNFSGPALLTDLFNYAMPLINYRIGDVIRMEKKFTGNYSYNGQIINKVLGRSSDIIILENGRVLTGPGFTILFKDLPVEHYFISKTGVNSITCKIVKLPGYNTTIENLITSTFRKHLGDYTHFNILYEEEIPVSQSGKRVYFSTNI